MSPRKLTLAGRVAASEPSEITARTSIAWTWVHAISIKARASKRFKGRQSDTWQSAEASLFIRWSNTIRRSWSTRSPFQTSTRATQGCTGDFTSDGCNASRPQLTVKTRGRVRSPWSSSNGPRSGFADGWYVIAVRLQFDCTAIAARSQFDRTVITDQSRRDRGPIATRSWPRSIAIEAPSPRNNAIDPSHFIRWRLMEHRHHDRRPIVARSWRDRGSFWSEIVAYSRPIQKPRHRPKEPLPWRSQTAPTTASDAHEFGLIFPFKKRCILPLFFNFRSIREGIKRILTKISSSSWSPPHLDSIAKQWERDWSRISPWFHRIFPLNSERPRGRIRANSLQSMRIEAPFLWQLG